MAPQRETRQSIGAMIASRFFEAWLAATSERSEELARRWASQRAFTSCMLKEPNSVVDAVAAKLGWKCYDEYYSIDAIMFAPEDRIPEAPANQTWVRRIRVALEHENNFESGLFRELSHLLITDCDLRVLVSYTNDPERVKRECAVLHRIVSGSDRARAISDAGSLLFIIGSGYLENAPVVWQAFVYSTEGWIPPLRQPVSSPPPA